MSESVLRASGLRKLYPSGDLWVQDLGSRNFTFVGGRQLAAQERVKLRTGDEVRLSKQIVLRI